MEFQLEFGRAGIPIRVFGTTARHFSSEAASASVFLGATGGAGTTGVAIGITTTQITTTRGITREAVRFTTVTDFIEGKARAVCTTVPNERQNLSPATTEPLAGMTSLAVRAMFAPLLRT